MQWNIKASIHHSIWMDWKVLQTQQLTGGWWMRGLGRARRQQTWSVFFFLSSLVFTSRPGSIVGRDGSREGRGRARLGGVCEGRIVQLLLLCWFHPWLQTPVVPALHHQHPHPPIHLGGHPASVCSVPCLGGDQGLTNDVYAVVLVDICWQNRSPVRHLEWN